ncbi:MAG: hypothetical protein ACREU9_13060 [Gammaproteobacteria bacterium]
MSVKDLFGKSTLAVAVSAAQKLASRDVFPPNNVGFLLRNYPRGKVFLGDAGAYFIGFMYAQLSIQLVARNAGISPWFVVALAAYPIVETLFSIYRRKIVRALSFYDNTPALIGFTLIYGIYYIVCYRKVVRLSGDMMPRLSTPSATA